MNDLRGKFLKPDDKIFASKSTLYLFKQSEIHKEKKTRKLCRKRGV